MHVSSFSVTFSDLLLLLTKCLQIFRTSGVLEHKAARLQIQDVPQRFPLGSIQSRLGLTRHQM